MQHEEKVSGGHYADENDAESSPALDYAKQLMQPEWMIEVPDSLHSDW